MRSAIDHNDQIVDQFSRQAESYARLTGSLTPQRSQALHALLQPKPDDVALEVCCGPGALTLDLAPAVHRVIGMDVTPAMLEQARARQAQSDLGNIDWMLGDINNIPFDDAHFSIVMCSSAFHHLEHPRRAFAEMLRVCRPGGRILIKDVTPAADKVKRYDAMEKLRDPSHTHALTVDELRALGAGFDVEEVSVTTNVTPLILLEAVLATSFPEAGSLDKLRALFREDALHAEDRLGFSATLVDDEIRISYRMSTALWTRR
jgi:ubiquinone/menaquinone biosynthesis C-methylase UbiE